MNRFRCSDCFVWTPDSDLREVDGEWLCVATCFRPWYALSVEEKKEHRVAKEIKRQVIIHDLEDVFHRVLVPQHFVSHTKKDGKTIRVPAVTFPGYILIQTKYDDRMFHTLREVKFVYGLVPHHEHPTPLHSKEAAMLLLKKARQREDGKAEVKLRFKVGSLVKVTDSTFRGLTASVRTIDGDPADPVVSAVVTIFGRPVPIQLKHWQVEPC